MKKGIRRYFIILIVIIVCIVTLVDCTNPQTRQEERTSASHLIINWENEVQIFDADAMEKTGMVENIETLAWIAPRGGAGINTVGIEQVQSQNEYYLYIMLLLLNPLLLSLFLVLLNKIFYHIFLHLHLI